MILYLDDSMAALLRPFFCAKVVRRAWYVRLLSSCLPIGVSL
jgi:hypothetical protein